MPIPASVPLPGGHTTTDAKRKCGWSTNRRYRVADDLAEPLAVVVAVAERDAEVDPGCPGRCGLTAI
jgi:hypothetical protein